jgi:hypothetical protein
MLMFQSARKCPVETVRIEINIQRRPNALPQKAKRLDADYSHVHYSKSFALNVRGRRYEFAFYRSETRFHSPKGEKP